MSKDQEKKEPLNYSEYMYAGDETITMSAQAFIAMRKGLEKALKNGVRGDFQQVLSFFNMETGERVEKPTKKQLDSGKVKQFADNELTFADENLAVTYDSNVYPEIYNGMQTAMVVHQEMADQGVAKTKEEVKKWYEERKSKGQMKVQSEEAPQEERKATMNVVKDENK